MTDARIQGLTVESDGAVVVVTLDYPDGSGVRLTLPRPVGPEAPTAA
jgi:hypothetical protein